MGCGEWGGGLSTGFRLSGAGDRLAHEGVQESLPILGCCLELLGRAAPRLTDGQDESSEKSKMLTNLSNGKG